MKKFLMFSALAIVLCGCVSNRPKNVILLIGDGMGVAQRTIAEEYSRRQGNGMLAMHTLPHQGITRTVSASSLVTDSAAAGTAMACGVKTNKGYLGLDPQGQSYDSCAVLAKRKGCKVGLLTTVPITHATPAAFYAHVKDRNATAEIAVQLKEVNFDYCQGDIPVASQNPQALADATEAALQKLANPKGFFLMVEGGQIDWACHDNEPHKMLQETLAFDAAVKVALAFQAGHPDTLILVTGDHETGGLSLGCTETGYAYAPDRTAEGSCAAGLGWTTNVHTGSFVITSAQGPQAERFTGFTENTDIGNILKTFYQ